MGINHSHNDLVQPQYRNLMLQAIAGGMTYETS